MRDNWEWRSCVSERERERERASVKSGETNKEEEIVWDRESQRSLQHWEKFERNNILQKKFYFNIVCNFVKIVMVNWVIHLVKNFVLYSPSKIFQFRELKIRG